MFSKLMWQSLRLSTKRSFDKMKAARKRLRNKPKKGPVTETEKAVVQDQHDARVLKVQPGKTKAQAQKVKSSAAKVRKVQMDLYDYWRIRGTGGIVEHWGHLGHWGTARHWEHWGYCRALGALRATGGTGCT